MYQRSVSGIVPQRVVQFLEVVDVDQRNAKRGLASRCARGFLFKCFFQAAAIQYAGQLVVTHQLAGAVQFVLKLTDFLLGFLNPLARRLQFIT